MKVASYQWGAIQGSMLWWSDYILMIEGRQTKNKEDNMVSINFSHGIIKLAVVDVAEPPIVKI